MEKIINKFFEGVMTICKVFMVIQVIVVSIVFFGRYVFGITPGWGEPLALLSLVWMCILSSALSVRDDSHLRMSILDKYSSPRVMMAFDILTTVVTGVFAIFMLYAGVLLIQTTAVNTITGLYISSAWMMLVVPFTGLVYLVALVERWMRRARA